MLRISVTITISMLVLVGGCAKKEPVKPVGQVERIVSLAPNLTEILFAMGLGEKVVAVSDDSDYPPAAGLKTRVGGFWQPNTEAIVAQKPDLVVTLWFEQQQAVADTLGRLGVPVVTVRIETIKGLFEAITAIGEAAGCEEAAAGLEGNIRAELEEVRKSAILGEKRRVLWVIQDEPMRVVGRKAFVNEIIEAAGGENAIGETIAKYPDVGSEEILRCGAEVIIQSAMGRMPVSEQKTRIEGFWKEKYPSLPAVKEGRIYVLEGDTTLRPGPRLGEGAKAVAECLKN